MILHRTISCISEIVFAVFWREAFEDFADAVVEAVNGSLPGFAEPVFER